MISLLYPESYCSKARNNPPLRLKAAQTMFSKRRFVFATLHSPPVQLNSLTLEVRWRTAAFQIIQSPIIKPERE
jgi:hypothetical protein